MATRSVCTFGTYNTILIQEGFFRQKYRQIHAPTYILLLKVVPIPTQPHSFLLAGYFPRLFFSYQKMREINLHFFVTVGNSIRYPVIRSSDRSKGVLGCSQAEHHPVPFPTPLDKPSNEEEQTYKRNIFFRQTGK